MSGHSKWSKVKHQKATTDAVKASAFTKASRAISMAVKEGGGIADPEKNYKLRLAIEKAKDVNMPKDNIERAIAKASLKGEGEIVEALYEAMGPGSVAFLIATVSDNTNRTLFSVKNVLDRNGGTMVAQGAVRHLFTLSGIIVLTKNAMSYDEAFSIALENGADDVIELGEQYEMYSAPDKLHSLKQHLESRSITVDNAEIIYRPIVTVPVNEEILERIEELKSKLEETEDVQHIYSNEVQSS